MFRLIKTELLKLKHSPIWLGFLLIPIIPAIIGTINYSENIDILYDTWYSLWTQHTIFTCYFFLPILIGIFSSYLMGLEHTHQNWNKHLTIPYPLYKIFLSKVIVGSLLIFLCLIWVCILFIISGKIYGLNEPIPLQLIEWLLLGTLGGSVIITIQLLISMIIKSFPLSVGISLAGGISGIIALAKGIGHIYPYALLPLGMRANAPQQILETGIYPFIFMCLCFIVLLSFLATIWLMGKDF